MDLNKILEDAKSWAREAGAIQLDKLENKPKYSVKSTKYDLVTEVDILSEKILIDKIKEAYPDHSILSEEKGLINNKDNYMWIIDPIDGTTNYFHGFPIFSISMALKHMGRTVLGLVYVPKLDEMFTAIEGEGAYLNGYKISVSDTDNLAGAVLATGFPYDIAQSDVNNIDLFNAFVRDIQGIRRSGSAAFDLCCVACGRLDGFWELKLSHWDVAAGALIIKEAGGNIITSDIEKINGEMGINIIAGNAQMVSIIYKRIKSVAPYFS